jgi:hypothetical protein
MIATMALMLGAGLLAGVAIGLLRCKVFVLLPSLALICISASGVALAAPSKIAMIALATVLVVIGLQIGYLLGAAIQYVADIRREKSQHLCRHQIKTVCHPSVAKVPRERSCSMTEPAARCAFDVARPTQETRWLVEVCGVVSHFFAPPATPKYSRLGRGRRITTWRADRPLIQADPTAP